MFSGFKSHTTGPINEFYDNDNEASKRISRNKLQTFHENLRITKLARLNKAIQTILESNRGWGGDNIPIKHGSTLKKIQVLWDVTPCRLADSYLRILNYLISDPSKIG